MRTKKKENRKKKRETERKKGKEISTGMKTRGVEGQSRVKKKRMEEKMRTGMDRGVIKK